VQYKPEEGGREHLVPFPYIHAPPVVEIRGLDRLCLYPYRGTTKFRSPSLGFSLSRSSHSPQRRVSRYEEAHVYGPGVSTSHRIRAKLSKGGTVNNSQSAVAVPQLNRDVIQAQASENWLAILSSLRIQVPSSLKQHGPCPTPDTLSCQPPMTMNLAITRYSSPWPEQAFD
jgi:hypothetical protein